MTTQSGWRYRTDRDMAEPVTQESDTLAEARAPAEVDQLVKILMAEREKREKEFAE